MSFFFVFKRVEPSNNSMLRPLPRHHFSNSTRGMDSRSDVVGYAPICQLAVSSKDRGCKKHDNLSACSFRALRVITTDTSEILILSVWWVGERHVNFLGLFCYDSISLRLF